MTVGKQKESRPFRRNFLRGLRVLAIVYGGLVILMWAFADKIIFQPPRPAGYGESGELIQLATADGATIRAMYFTHPEAEFTLLLSHGNAEDLGTSREMNEYYAAQGYNVLAYDYHGYGLSEGRPTEQNAYQDIEAAWNWLIEQKKTPPGRIILVGRSVGSGPATWLAVRKPAGGLILEAPFVSAFRVVTRIPILPFDKFKNLSRIGHVNCPVLIVHGRVDTVVPFWHGRKLYDRAGEPKINLWIDEADHNDLIAVAGERYWRAIEELISWIKSDRVKTQPAAGPDE